MPTKLLAWRGIKIWSKLSRLVSLPLLHLVHPPIFCEVKMMVPGWAAIKRHLVGRFGDHIATGIGVGFLRFTRLDCRKNQIFNQQCHKAVINKRLCSLIFFIIFLSLGEGFHNFHHTFPFDYATSEFGWRFNVTTAFIDAMSFLGLASDCKTAKKETIMARKIRTGDGSHKTGWKHAAFTSLIFFFLLETTWANI